MYIFEGLLDEFNYSSSVVELAAPVADELTKSNAQIIELNQTRQKLMDECAVLKKRANQLQNNIVNVNHACDVLRNECKHG